METKRSKKETKKCKKKSKNGATIPKKIKMKAKKSRTGKKTRTK